MSELYVCTRLTNYCTCVHQIFLDMRRHTTCSGAYIKMYYRNYYVYMFLRGFYVLMYIPVYMHANVQFLLALWNKVKGL